MIFVFVEKVDFLKTCIKGVFIMLKKITSSFLAVLSVILLLPPFVNTVYAESSGACGEGVTYSFERATGTLTISGNRNMESYLRTNKVPWSSYKDSIKSVTIKIE